MKWSRIKRITSLVLCVLMVFALLPVSSLAEEANTPAPATEATPAPAGEHTAPADSATPAQPDAAEETPSPAPSPAEETNSPDPQAYVVNFVIDGETKWDLQQTVTQGETAMAPSIPAVPAGEAYVGQMFLYLGEICTIE